jgi:outer membrane protein OmpA-like peptidoglycan-associated protein
MFRVIISVCFLLLFTSFYSFGQAPSKTKTTFVPAKPEGEILGEPEYFPYSRSLALPVFSRSPYLQVYQGCGSGGYKLRKDGTVKFKRGMPVEDSSVSSPESRLVFRFAPKPTKPNLYGKESNGQVSFDRGENIPFVIMNAFSAYGEAMKNTGKPLVSNPTIGAPGGNIDYEKPLNDLLPPRDGWYVFTQYLGTKLDTSKPIEYRNPDLNKERNGKPLSLNSEGLPEMMTGDMEPGFYLVTLQNTATFVGQAAKPCEKTTNPVIIEILDELSIELKSPPSPVSFQNAGRYAVPANIKGNGPFELEWKSSNPTGVDVSACPKNPVGNQVICYAVTVPGNITEGEIVEITATVINKSRRTADCRKNDKCAKIIINNVPRLALNVEDNRTTAKNGYPIIVTARASDIDVPNQRLTIKDWKLSNRNNPNVPLPADHTIVVNGNNSQTLTINSGLEVGQYTFKATVSDTLDENAGDTTNTRTPPRILGGLINYFGFANPFLREKLDFNPENWTVDNRPANLMPYPSREFDSFYIKAGFSLPASVETNTEKLEDIAKKLKANPDFKLYIYGYADYKRTKNYSNIALAQRRIDVVIGRLRNLGIAIDQLVDAGVVKITNCSDKTADRRYKNNWIDIRRHDRRVELIYAFGNEEPKIPDYTLRCNTSSSTRESSSNLRANK